MPPGPLLAKLKNGEDITLEDGRVVRKADVCEPDTSGPAFMVVEVPTERHLSALLENARVKRYRRGASQTTTTTTTDGEGLPAEDVLAVVVHLTSESILRSER